MCIDAFLLLICSYLVSEFSEIGSWLLRATQGQILIDGIDLRDLEINTLRRMLAVVSQNAFTFNTSRA